MGTRNRVRRRCADFVVRNANLDKPSATVEPPGRLHRRNRHLPDSPMVLLRERYQVASSQRLTRSNETPTSASLATVSYI